MANRERRELLSRLPFGGERGRPARIAVEIPFVVGEGKRAIRAALEQEVAAHPEHEQIHVAVTVEVERIGADDVGEQLRIRADVERSLFEFESAASLGFVDEQSGWILTPARNTEGKPEPSQSNAAPPPPTKNSHGPS
jgi:hypothetical protein